MSELKVGDHGYICDHGDYWPARVICDDLLQTGGRVDQAVAYEMANHASHEFIVRLTRGSDPCGGKYWVSRSEFNEIETNRVAVEMGKLKARLDAISA